MVCSNPNPKSILHLIDNASYISYSKTIFIFPHYEFCKIKKRPDSSLIFWQESFRGSAHVLNIRRLGGFRWCQPWHSHYKISQQLFTCWFSSHWRFCLGQRLANFFYEEPESKYFFPLQAICIQLHHKHSILLL